MICNSNSWRRSYGETEEEEDVGSQEEEEEKFCWVWRAKLTILVALRRIFLLADLLSIDCCGDTTDASASFYC